MPSPNVRMQEQGPAPLHTLVFVVHGDANYSYHDLHGSARRADEDVVAEARAIAVQTPHADVHIFHQIKRRHFLFVFPRRDGRSYHYRNGHLVGETSYWRDEGPTRLAPEIRILEQYAGEEPPGIATVLLYFGHELPEFHGAGYDASHKDRHASIDDLAELAGAAADSWGKLDLLVLATCSGGTPHAIRALAPHARYVVASPEDLHLSYFDLQPLAQLEIGSDDDAVQRFAASLTHHAFERLTSEVQTPVSVVLYDTEAARPFLDSVAGTYSARLSDAEAMPEGSFVRCDCAAASEYVSPEMGDGLEVLYRAPRFGRMKHTRDHSGWACWRAVEAVGPK
jgi:hypothetical protein